MQKNKKYLQEEILIARIKKGDTDAFFLLIGGYRTRLFRKACSVMGNADDAEDVLQESLLTAYRALDRFRGESGIYTWLYRILINKCRDQLRSKQNKSEESIEFHSMNLSDSRINIEKNLELSDGSAYLIARINSLNKKYREVLLLRYFDELSYQELANCLHTNIGTIKSRLFKARELLKRAIVRESHGEDFFSE